MLLVRNQSSRDNRAMHLRLLGWIMVAATTNIATTIKPVDLFIAASWSDSWFRFRIMLLAYRWSTCSITIDLFVTLFGGRKFEVASLSWQVEGEVLE